MPMSLPETDTVSLQAVPDPLASHSGLLKKLRTSLNPLNPLIFFACIGGLWLVVTLARLLSNLVLERSLLHAIEVSSVTFVLASSWLLYYLITKSRNEATLKSTEPLKRLVRALKSYSECHQALIRATDERQLMSDICRIFIEVGGYRMAWVGIAAEDNARTITPVAGWGDDQDFIEIFKSTCMNRNLGHESIKDAIRTGTPLVLQHAQKEPVCELCRTRCLRQGVCSSIFLPLSNRGTTFAALMLYSSFEKVFDEEEVTLLTNLVSDLSYGITSLRVAAENQKVEKQRRLLSSVIAQMRAGLFLIDKQEVIQYANPAAEKIVGVPASRLVGKSIINLSIEEDDRRFYEVLLSDIAKGSTLPTHFQHKRQDGVLLELELTTWTLTDTEGTVISHVGMLRDITHEMQLESQLRRAQRMEALGILAGGIAHDFNNALASIITCTEMAIDDTVEGSTQRELLDVVLKSGLRGKDLVRQILTFSRQTEQAKQEVKVDLIAKECLKLLRSTLPPSIEIRLQIDAGLSVVFADPTQMHQIVMNLCTNAVHAMREHPHGVLELALENRILDQQSVLHFINLVPGPYLRLSVRDNGHGMDQATIERIFDPFFSTKIQTEGTGLGLSVIHGIITKLGGTITVKSTPGYGSQFDVYIPASSTDQPAPEPCTSSTCSGSPSERILLVDDEVNLVFGATLMLKQLGYSVVSRTDPVQALELFCSSPESFDLVITDQAMPNMNGMEMAAQMAAIRPGIPIILCTGYDPTSGYGMDQNGQNADYISELVIKPLERHELAGTLRKVFDSQTGGGAQWPTC